MKMSLGQMMDDMKTTSEEKVYRMPHSVITPLRFMGFSFFFIYIFGPGHWANSSKIQST